MMLIDYGFLTPIIDFVSIIFGFLSPILVPIGQMMVLWIDQVLPLFPTGSYGFDDLGIYIIIFAILLFFGAIINCVWPGDKPKDKEEEDLDEDFLRLTQALSLKEWKEEKIDKKKSKKSVATLIPKKDDKKEGAQKTSESDANVRKCKECNMPIEDAETCPFCGASN